MAEVAGLVASAISIVALAKTCIDLYDIVDDAKHAADDQNQLVSLLKIERLRFFLWCQYVGIIELVSLREGNGANFELDEKEIFRLTPKLQKHGFIRNVIINAFQHISQDFESCHELLESYTNKKLISVSSSIIQKSLYDKKVNLAEEVLSRSYQESSKMKKRNMTVWETTKWTVKDKKRLRMFVERLRLHNSGLESVLGFVEKLQLQRQRELFATTTPFVQVILTSRSLNEEYHTESNSRGSLRNSMLDMPRLVESSHRIDEIDREILPRPENQTSPLNLSFSSSKFSDDGHLLASHIEIIAAAEQISQESDENDREFLPKPVNHIPPLNLSLSSSTLSDDGHLLASHIEIIAAAEKQSQIRSNARYKSRPVLVEWKYYSTRIGQDLLVKLKHRVSMLATQLQQSAKISGFSILSCVGHFDEQSRNRVGIVFEYPLNDKPSRSLSLRQILVHDRSSRNVRDLGSRFAVAKALALTCYRLHSVGWLHKSYRSDNIIFFESFELDKFDLPTPYICGFDFSRQDSPLEMTENISTILLSQFVTQERALYRHPELDNRMPILRQTDNEQEFIDAAIQKAKLAASKFRYRKAYDVYSLGIVLLEIGLWCPIKDLYTEKDSIKTFRHRLHENLLPELRYRTGRIYHDVVKRCLEGEFTNNNIETGTATGQNNTEIDDEAQESRDDRRWLENFQCNIVSELEKCNV